MGNRKLVVAVDLSMIPEEMGWYPVVTQIGYEEVFAGNLVAAARNALDTWGDQVDQVFVPVSFTRPPDKDRVSRSLGVWATYAFVHCRMDKQLWTIIRNTTGMALVVSSGNQPKPIDDEQMARVVASCDFTGLTDDEREGILRQRRLRFTVRPSIEDVEAERVHTERLKAAAAEERAKRKAASAERTKARAKAKRAAAKAALAAMMEDAMTGGRRGRTAKVPLDLGPDPVKAAKQVFAEPEPAPKPIPEPVDKPTEDEGPREHLFVDRVKGMDLIQVTKITKTTVMVTLPEHVLADPDLLHAVETADEFLVTVPGEDMPKHMRNLAGKRSVPLDKRAEVQAARTAHLVHLSKVASLKTWLTPTQYMLKQHRLLKRPFLPLVPPVPRRLVDREVDEIAVRIIREHRRAAEAAAAERERLEAERARAEAEQARAQAEQARIEAEVQAAPVAAGRSAVSRFNARLARTRAVSAKRSPVALPAGTPVEVLAGVFAGRRGTLRDDLRTGADHAVVLLDGLDKSVELPANFLRS